MKFPSIILVLILLIYGCGSLKRQDHQKAGKAPEKSVLKIKQEVSTGTIVVFRKNSHEPILTQHALPDRRPYIHPIVAPDGKGILTQFSPEHHKHQTGLYWGLKLVNGRDYFMNWQGDYWRQVSAIVMQGEGKQIKWRTVYDLLDEQKNTILTETQNWTMEELDGHYLLDLEWQGEARKDIFIGKFYVGGLFLRMPWHKDIKGQVINSNGQRNQEAEGQRAAWADIGLQVEGRDDLAHIALFDHPGNPAFPSPWRVDGELGIGPSRQILGDRILRKGDKEYFRYRLMVYTGELNKAELNRWWKEYTVKPD